MTKEFLAKKSNYPDNVDSRTYIRYAITPSGKEAFARVSYRHDGVYAVSLITAGAKSLSFEIKAEDVTLANLQTITDEAKATMGK